MDQGEPTLQEAVTEVSRIWWLVMIVGILFVGFGIVMLFDVAAGATTIAIIVGAFLIFDGLVEIITGGQHHGARIWSVLLGLLLVAGGIVVIVWPGVTFLAIAIVWGITMLVGGIVRAIAAATIHEGSWGWLVALGIVEAIIGILILAWPDVTAYVILLLIGVYSIVAGILQIVLAVELRKAPDRFANLS